MAKGTVPNVTDTAGLTKALPDDQLPMQLDEEGLQVIDLYFNQRKELFPNQSWQNKAYHQLATQKEKSVFLAKYPELKQYWEWNNIYKKQNPVLKQWLERNDMFEGSEQQDPYYGIDPAIIEGYRAEKAQKFPNSQWLNAQYYAIPADQYDARKAFIKQYPELEAYWAWKKDIETRSPQIKYYNAEMDAAYEANNAFPVAPSDMAPNKIAEALDSLGILPYVQQDLIAYYVQGKPIPYGSMNYLKDMWEKAGKPDTLMEYIDNLF